MFDSTDQLRTALHNSVTDLNTTPENLLPTLRTRYAQRVTTRRISFITTPLVVAAAIAGSTAITPHTHPASASATTPVHDAAYLTAKTTQAIDTANTDITYLTWAPTPNHGHTQLFQMWVQADGTAVHQQWSLDGNLIGDSQRTNTGILVVNHKTHTFYHAPANGTGAILTNGTNTVGFPLPQEIKQALATNTVTIIGHEVINGQPTIHLHITGPTPGFPHGTPLTDIWINQTNYLPIQINYGPHHQTQNYTWLPPTPENQALLTAPIPTGYTETPYK